MSSSGNFGYGFGDSSSLGYGSLGLGDSGFSADYGLSLADQFGPASNMSATASATTAPAEYGFVDSMSENERARRIAAQTTLGLLGPQLSDTLGPIGPIGTSLIGSALGLQSPEQSARSNFASIAGMLGSAIAGPIGGVIGAAFGRSASRGPMGPGRGSGVGNGNGVMGAMNLGDIAGTLAGLYQANKSSKDARNASNGVTGAVNQQLADMFGPNSAYAQQLRQQLERRDAASGRRSQYGAREVELQAKLAEMQSRSMPGIMNAMTQQQQAALVMQQQRRAQQNAMLNGLLGLGRKSGLFDRAEASLNDLFGNNTGGVDFVQGNYDVSPVNYSLTTPEAYYMPNPSSSFDLSGGYSSGPGLSGYSGSGEGLSYNGDLGSLWSY
jgi:hypothetical protein